MDNQQGNEQAHQQTDRETCSATGELGSLETQQNCQQTACAVATGQNELGHNDGLRFRGNGQKGHGTSQKNGHVVGQHVVDGPVRDVMNGKENGLLMNGQPGVKRIKVGLIENFLLFNREFFLSYT